MRPKLGVVKFLYRCRIRVLVKFEGRSRGDVIFFMLIIIIMEWPKSYCFRLWMRSKVTCRGAEEGGRDRCGHGWNGDCISAILPSLHYLFIYIFHTGVSQPGEQGQANRHPPLKLSIRKIKNVGGYVVFRYLDVKSSLCSIWLFLPNFMPTYVFHNVLCIERATLTHFIWNYLIWLPEICSRYNSQPMYSYHDSSTDSMF